MQMTIGCICACISMLFACAPLRCQHGSRELITEIQEKLRAISFDELEQLKELFNYLFLRHGFAYTLFGDKPMSCDCSFHEHLAGLFQGSKEQFRIWEKYASLFPSQKYIFLFYEHDSSEEEYKFEITFINKQSFVNIFEKHRDSFITYFGKSITAEKLLDLLIEKKSPWNTPLKERDDLLGILFGYGKINAELYQRRKDIESVLGANRHIKKRKTVQATQLKKWIYQIRKPSCEFSSFEKELSHLQQRLEGFSADEIRIKRMSLPGFVADNSHLETKALIKKYKQQRRDILKKYDDGCMVETSLLQLCAE